jgi:hypothetical protein
LRAQASGFGAPPFASEAAAYGIAEWTPLHWFSLGSGLGYEMLAPRPTCHGMGPCSVDYPHWYGLSVPFLVGFNLVQMRYAAGVQRAAIRLGLEGALGLDPSIEAYGWHMAMSLGLALM